MATDPNRRGVGGVTQTGYCLAQRRRQAAARRILKGIVPLPGIWYNLKERIPRALYPTHFGTTDA